MKFSQAISRVKWLNGEKTNVSKFISVLVLRVPIWVSSQSPGKQPGPQFLAKPLLYAVVESPAAYRHQLFCLIQRYDTRWQHGLYSYRRSFDPLQKKKGHRIKRFESKQELH